MRPFDLSRPWAWLLTLSWPVGQPLRLSSRPLAIADRAGRTAQYIGGLPPLRWRQEAPLFDVAVGQGSLSVDVDLGKDYAQVHLEHPIEEARAELALHFLGETWEQRHRAFKGRVGRAVLGVQRQLASLEIVEETFEDAGLLVSEEWTLTTTEWPNIVEQSIGQVYPRVYGAPGVYRSTTGEATVAGSPCWIVTATTPTLTNPFYGLIAGHHVAATTVTILNATTGISAVKPVTNMSIGAGPSRRLVAVANLFDLVDFDDTITPLAATIDDDYYVIWSGGGATYTQDRVRAARGVGEILEHALGFSSLAVDRARVASARSILDRYRIDTYINETISPWEWTRRAVIPVAPVSVVSGPQGIYPVPWRIDADPSHAVAHLEIGRNASWASRDEPGDADTYTEVRVWFAPDDTSGDAQRLVRVRPENRVDNDTGRCSHAVRATQGRASYTTAVTARLLEQTLDQTHDADTAWLVAHDELRLGFRRARVVEIDVDRQLSGLEFGDVVTITGADRAWDRRVGHVHAVEWASAYTRISAVVPYQ